jgi:hypothetical protein
MIAFLGTRVGLVMVVLLGAGGGSFAEPLSAGPAPPLTTSAPTLLFKSNFGPGVSLGAPRNLYAPSTGGGGGWQDLAGTDRETGFIWPVAALGAKFSGIQLITVDPITPETVGEHITAEIRQVPGPNGTPVSALFQRVHKKAPAGMVPAGKGHAQAPLILIRPAALGDVPDVYLSYWFKHQADLATQLDNTVPAGNWRAQFEFKTGGYRGIDGQGDYRIITYVMKGADGRLFWRAKGDNDANGPRVGPRVDYWIEDNSRVPVPVDAWFKYEVFWHRSSGSDGRFWAAVNGQVVADHHGPNMGAYNLPITRLMITTAYSGGHSGVQSLMTGLEIWNGFPCGVGVSCY